MVILISGFFGIYDKFFKWVSMGVGDYILIGNCFWLMYVGFFMFIYMGFDILVIFLKGLCCLLKKILLI